MKQKYRSFFALLCLTIGNLPAAPQLNISTVPTVGAIGNSISRNQYSPMKWGGLVGFNRQWTSFGAFVFFACGEIAIPDIYSFEGFSGKTASEIDSLLQSENATEPWGVGQTISIGIAARRPDITIIISSTNDLLLTSPADIKSGQALENALKGIRLNMIQLLPHLNELLVYDNSKSVKKDASPIPECLIKITEGKIESGNSSLLRKDFPDWEQPIAMEAINTFVR